MVNPREFLSRDWRNDSWQQFWFTRDTKLPYGTFREGMTVDAIVYAVVGVAALVVVDMWWAGLL